MLITKIVKTILVSLFVLLQIIVSAIPAYAGDSLVVPIEKQVKDKNTKDTLLKQGINPDYVELIQDYALGYDISGKKLKEKSPYTRIYQDKISGKRIAEISTLPMVNSRGQVVDPRWYLSGGIYNAGANQFTAVVNGSTITMATLNDQPDGKTKSGDVLNYEPQVYIKGKLVKTPTATLLSIDPINSNYTYNTLEWDYGVCVRRLRIIEGSILGSWTFYSKSKDDITIKYNQSGNFRLRLGRFATDNDTEVIPTIAFDNPLEYFYHADYPFTVSDTSTYYPDAHTETSTVDGWVGNLVSQDTWSTVVNGAGTTADPTGTDLIFHYMGCGTTTNKFTGNGRAIFLFNTADIPDGATISSATFSLYGYSKVDYAINTPNINVFSSNPASNTNLVGTDYATIGTTELSTAITYASWSNSGYNDFSLNASGLALIDKTGVTKLATKNVTYDNNLTVPSWVNTYSYYIFGEFAESGNGEKPKLVVVYSSVVVPTVTKTATSDIKDLIATGNGNITATGGENPNKRGVCYSSSTNPPTTSDSKVEESGSFGTGAYTENITGLTRNTLYYLRAYAINSAGIGYSTVDTFTTYNSSADSSSAGMIVMGRMYPNESYPTGLTAFSTTNNGNCAIDITISGTDMTGGNTWTLSDTATPGANTFGIKAGVSGGDYTIIVKKTVTYNTLVSNLAIGATQQFGLKFYTPTSMDDAAVKTGTVTLNIVMH